MESVDFKVELWERMMDIRPRRKVNNSLLSIRCPFCGDSRKHLDSTHFYVKIDTTKDMPVVFMCQRCDTSGILTPSVLRSLEINELSLNSGLIRYNKAALKNAPFQLGITDNNFKFKVPMPDVNDERNIIKKEYYEGRLGIQTTFEDMVDKKIIFKLGQFLNFNEIESLTVGKEKAISLNHDYMGFLTTRNEFINFRQVFDSKFKRYEKYKIFNSLDNTRKFYTIPNEIDLLTTKKITINIAEGVFDIHGVYHHIYEGETKNMIYTAVCGAGFINVIKYFIKMGVIDNVDINIYSDDDRHARFYKPLARELQPWVNKINLFYNEKTKDFGVMKKDIKIKREKI